MVASSHCQKGLAVNIFLIIQADLKSISCHEETNIRLLPRVQESRGKTSFHLEAIQDQGRISGKKQAFISEQFQFC